MDDATCFCARISATAISYGGGLVDNCSDGFVDGYDGALGDTCDDVECVTLGEMNIDTECGALGDTGDDTEYGTLGDTLACDSTFDVLE